MRNKSPSDFKNPRVPLELAFSQLWKLPVKTRGEIGPDLTDLIFREMEIVDQPFGRRGYGALILNCSCDDTIGFKKCFIDHPFSPFIGLTVDEMKQFATSGVYMNFTYDELSPLLGTNPLEMFQAAAAVGIDHVLLSSDAGEPLFPDSVECIRLMRAYAEAFGMTEDQVHRMSVLNPARLMGAE